MSDFTTPPADGWALVLKGDIRRLKEDAAETKEMLTAIHTWMLGEKARREARADEEARLRAMLVVVDELRREVDVMRGELRAAEAQPRGLYAVASMRHMGAPLAFWAIVGAVACCLSLAGGMTYGDLHALIPAPASVRVVEVPVPVPGRAPYPSPPDALRAPPSAQGAP